MFLSISGYAKAKSVPLCWDKNRKFSLSVGFHFTDGSDAVYEHINFNPDTDVWQYASGTVGVKNPGDKIVDYVYLRCCYYRNANGASFDRIKVNIDQSGTSYTYDDDGNLISAKDNAGRHESYNYNNASDMTKLTTADNKAYKFTYSDTYKHRMLSATSESSGVKNSFTYDASGNLTKTRVDNSSYDKYIEQYSTYTSDGNYLKELFSDRGYATTYTYNNYKGTLTSATDANGNETQYFYNDDTDRMTIVEAIDSANKDNNSKVTYIYNKVGQLASISSPGDKTKYYFEYDNWGKNTKVKVGSQELVSNEYEPNNGLLKTQSYGNNFYVTHNYDSLDRESSRVYNDGNSDVAKYYWTYNADGNLARYSENGNRVLTYLYDDIGRLLQVSGNDGSYVKTSYDKFDKSTNLHYKFNGQRRDVYFFYDKKDNLPKSVQFGTGSAYTVTNLYDGLTRIYEKDYTLVGSTSGSELKAVYSYKPFDSKVPNRTTGTIQGINYTFTDGGLRTYDRWYTYDHAGNILTEGVWKTNAEKPVYETYTYDAKNQLVKHDSVTLNATFTYTYDVAGNIKSKTIYNKEDGTTSTIDYTYGNSNWKDELTAYGNENIEYDTIGNPTLYRGWTMGWEGRQLKSAGKNGTNLSFTYDSEGIRTSKTVGSTTTKYLLNGTQILAQTTNGKALSFFYDQQGNRVGMADSSNHFYYYIYNVQGDVIALADASTGKLAATYTYDAWGKIVKINGENPEDVASTNIANINPFRYRGYYYDAESKLYYLNSRYYDPDIGRFINEDMFATTNMSSALATNTFVYCNNNPVVFCDFYGTYSFLCTESGGNPNTASHFTGNKNEQSGIPPKNNKKDIAEDNSSSGSSAGSKKLTFACDSDSDMIVFVAVMSGKICTDVIGQISLCALGVGLVAAPTPGAQILGVTVFFESLFKGSVGTVSDITTLYDGISKYNKNGVIYVSYSIEPKHIVKWMLIGGIEVN